MKGDLREIGEGIQRAIPPAAVQVSRPKAKDAAGADFVVHLELRGVSLLLRGEWVSTASTALIKNGLARVLEVPATDPMMVPLLVAPRLTESQQRLVSEAGVAFVDLAGNAHIEADGVYVSKVAARRPAPMKSTAPNPFSDKASMVARQLMVARDPAGIRELSSQIGLTPGYVSKVVSKLESLGYLSRDSDHKVTVRDRKSLLQDWAVSYDFTKSGPAGFFCRSRSAVDIIERLRGLSPQGGYGLTAQAGAYLVAPHSAFDRVDVYSAHAAMTDRLISRLRLERVDRGANVIVWSPYYKHSVFFGSRDIEGIWVVSDIQLYLDLFKYPLRGPEQAQHLYDSRLRALVEPHA